MSQGSERVAHSVLGGGGGGEIESCGYQDLIAAQYFGLSFTKQDLVIRKLRVPIPPCALARTRARLRFVEKATQFCKVTWDAAAAKSKIKAASPRVMSCASLT